MTVSASCERRFRVELGLLVLDSFIGNLFPTVFHGFDSQSVDHLEYVRGDDVENTKTFVSSSLTGGAEQVETNLLLGWQVKASNLLLQTCGAESELLRQAGQNARSPPRLTEVRMGMVMLDLERRVLVLAGAWRPD
jgi:hypothetical protein